LVNKDRRILLNKIILLIILKIKIKMDYSTYYMHAVAVRDELEKKQYQEIVE
jgi:hypothetical protein